MRASKAILAATLTLAFTVMLSPVVHAYTVVPGHPRVDIRPADIPTFATRATGSHSSEYGTLKSWCDSHISDSTSMGSTTMGYHIEAYAFVYLVEKQLGHSYSAYSNRAKTLLAAMSGNLSYNANEANRAFARGFDWVYGELTASERSSYASKLATMGDNMMNYSDTSGTHRMARYVGSLVHVGLALYDDNPSKAQQFLDRSHWHLLDPANVYRTVDSWEEIGGDGNMYAGDYTHTNGLRWPAEWVHAWDVGTDGEDIMPTFGHLKYASLFYCYSARPNLVKQQVGDGYLYPKDPQAQIALYMLANVYRDGHAEWMASQTGLYWNTPQHWRYIAWNDKSVSVQPPNDLPKVHFFNIYGATYMRSGWDLTSGSSDIISNFRCHVRPDFHSHCDQGAFEIHRGPDYLAIDSGYGDCDKGESPPGYHFPHYYVQTVAHNSMLIYDPDEVFDWAGGSAAKIRANSGGQQFKYRLGPFPYGSRAPGGRNAIGFLKKYHDDTNYTYNYADPTVAYSSTGCELDGVNTKIDNFTRQYIYLKDRFFVVFDRVHSLDNPPSNVFKKSWLLHSINAPVIEDSGGWNGGATPNAYGGTPGTTSSNANVFSVSRGNSKLYIDTVYPVNHVATKIGGPDANGNYNNAGSYEWWAAGENHYDTFDHGPIEEDGRWRLEISPSGVDVRRDNIFLHVLEPVAATAARTPVARIEDPANGFYGVHIRHASEPWVVMCSEQEQLKQAVSYSITATGTVRHLICDLASGSGQYNVYRNGQLIPGSPFPVTESNTLYFEASGGGTFTVSEGPPPMVTINPVTTPTANATQTITGTKTTTVQTIQVNGSTSGVSITSSTTWSYAAQLAEGGNAFHVTAHNSSGAEVGFADTSITLDSVPPNSPTSLNATTITDHSISLAWNPPAAASDGDTASSYLIRRDGVQIDTATSASYTDLGLTALTSYSYEVFAVDDIGNVSATGASGGFTTLEAPSFETTSVNFEQPVSVTPSGFLKDSGLPYDSGRGYGWDTDLSSDTRDRELNTDQKIDTFIFATSTAHTWQYDIPNGEYLISLAAGDYWAAGPHRINVEGAAFISDQSTVGEEYIYVDRQPVTIADGNLTVVIGGSSGRTCLNYVIIEGQGGPPPTDETPPTGTASINAGAERTNSSVVVLSLLATDSGSGMGTGAQMQFSNDSSSWSSPEPYATSKSWSLIDVASGNEGTRTVYVKFKDVAGNWSQPINDSIILDKRPPQTPFGLQIGG